jgi:glucosamine--fructose-6-phosphate aminotransferase (isomerizing)
MCGIVGYIGKKQALPVLLDGIRNLEYRGYDSAGLAIIETNGKAKSVKSVGKVSFLEDKINGENFDGMVGIIHSRWATHGGVTEGNAHPHSDCTKSIWLVHNGIIENYRELKNWLAKKGHKFSSETDTEIAAHLIEEFQKDQNVSFPEAVALALKQIKGTYGLAIISTKNPNQLVVARNFSPLLIGIGEGEYFVGSDASAVIKHTKRVVYLNDGEYAVLSPDSFDVYTLSSRPVKKDIKELEWDMEVARKDGHPHFMLKEINSQSESVENSIRGRLITDEGTAKLGGLETIKKELRELKGLHIVGCGTAYLAGKVGEYMLEEYAQIPVKTEVGSEFRYKKPIFEKGDALLAISQSGETADTLAAIREAKEKGVLSLGIVNVVGSSISRETDAGVYQHIGPEVGVASTKTFTSQVVILALLTLFLGRQRAMSLVMGQRIANEIKKLPALIKEVLKTDSIIKEMAEKYSKYKNFLYLGRKYNLPVAFEGALKIKEISYIHAEGIGAGEMKHGPLAMIDENFPSVVIVPKDSVYEKNISNIQEIKARGGPVLAIATKGDKEIAKLANDVIYIPKTLEMLTPVLSIIPLQIFAYHFAVLKGCDVDKPRNLAKSVTVE